MVYGNPSCYSYAQSCNAGCCNYYGECPNFMDPYCYYYYYSYETTRVLSTPTAIGIGVGVAVFVIVGIIIGCICYRRRQMGIIGTAETTVVMASGPAQFGQPMMPPPMMPMGPQSPMYVESTNVVFSGGQANMGYNPWQ